jgi:hypothetical protein
VSHELFPGREYLGRRSAGVRALVALDRYGGNRAAGLEVAPVQYVAS